MYSKFNENLTKPTTIGLIGLNIPKILLSKVAKQKMEIYVSSVDTEIGWLGSVTKLENGDYYISDVFLLDQNVTGTTTEITADGLHNLIMDFVNNDKKDVINTLKFWGHSHVNMDVEPSLQDEETLNMLKPDVDPDFFLRGIFNKKGAIKFTLYDYEHKIQLDNLNWELFEPPLVKSFYDEIKAEIEKKLKKNSTAFYYVNGKMVSYNQTNGNHFKSNSLNQEQDYDKELEELDEIDEMDDDEFYSKYSGSF